MLCTFLLLFLLSPLTASAGEVFVTTIHPFKLIIDPLVTGRVRVEILLPPGASPHTHEMVPSHLRRVESAGAIILGGPGLDGWALSIPHPNRIVLLELLAEPHRLKLVGSYGVNRGRDLGVDPHFWSDPLAVKSLLPPLLERLRGIDPEGERIYLKNAAAFAADLEALTARIDSVLAPIRNRPIMLSHPFFQYFINRFQLRLCGIIEAVPGSPPTPREISTIIKSARDRGVRLILTHPQLSDRPAQLVAEAAGIGLLELDPIGNVSGLESYSELMLHNAGLLLEALE